MADVKWIKLYTDMASNKKIKRIRKMPEGNNIILIWVFLLIQAGDCNKNGALYLTDTIPFKAEDLAIEFEFSIETINFALITLEKYGMIEIFEEVIFIKNWSEYQNIDGMDKIREQNRIRKQKEREIKRLLQSDAISETTGALGNNMSRDMSRDVTPNVTQCHATEREEEREIERDKEIDIERDKETESEEELSLFNEAIEICKYFETVTCGKSITQHIAEIKMFIEMYTKPWVLEAVDIAVSNGVVSLSYIRKILKNWASDGKKTKKGGSQQNGSSKQSAGSYGPSAETLRLEKLARDKGIITDDLRDIECDY